MVYWGKNWSKKHKYYEMYRLFCHSLNKYRQAMQLADILPPIISHYVISAIAMSQLGNYCELSRVHRRVIRWHQSYTHVFIYIPQTMPNPYMWLWSMWFFISHIGVLPYIKFVIWLYLWHKSTAHYYGGELTVSHMVGLLLGFHSASGSVKSNDSPALYNIAD